MERLKTTYHSFDAWLQKHPVAMRLTTSLCITLMLSVMILGIGGAIFLGFFLLGGGYWIWLTLYLMVGTFLLLLMFGDF